MKIFKFLAVALVAMLGFTACDKDCDHDFIEHDFTQDIVGTWTTLNGELAEAMVIKADGSFTTTGIAKGGSLYEEKGTIKVVNNKVTLAFDGDKETFEGRLEFVAGKSLSLVMFDDNDVRLTYDYCENDLSDEVIGMWVNNNAPAGDEGVITIKTFKENGKSTFTGYGSSVNGYVVKDETDYKVVGDLLFYALPQNAYIVKRLTYAPDGNAYGDIMVQESQRLIDDKVVEATSSMLRVKQELNLTGKTYDYVSAYVTNAKGTDEDFSIMGNTFNMSNIKANDIDMMFRSILSCIGLNANSFKYKLRLDGREIEMNDPITVEGNKVTLDMSVSNPACRKVDMHMFQDADDCQLHIYMPTSSFINYFANLQIPTLVQEGKLDTTDAAAVAKVFADMEARIESINVSLVYKARD